ncbi:MAG: DUF2974 domain-containing protein [Clostridia bacterium]|nr:DUF2974 domain-containing protein [Clostridia bacterium]
MSNITTYIEQFGNIPFAELPYTDADDFSLNNIFYMPLEKVAPSVFESKPKTLGHYAQAFYALHDYKMVPAGLVLPKHICRRLVKMSSSRRFAAIKLTGVRSILDKDNTVQFAAATFILPNKTNIIMFRGTDDTICGWIEDFDLLLKGKTGSHDLTVQYLEEAAKALEGDIYVTGHSKGGHLALYAALMCSPETRKRIKRVYNNDGPGFNDSALIESEAYREILPCYRHYIPDSSMFGLMLKHDYDYKVVKSFVPLLGLVQHDISTWQLDGAIPVTVNDVTKVGKMQDVAFARVIEEATPENVNGFRTILNDCFEATGTQTLTGFVKNIVPAVPKMIRGYFDHDKETRSNFWQATLLILGNLAKAGLETVKGELEFPGDLPVTAK